MNPDDLKHFAADIVRPLNPETLLGNKPVSMQAGERPFIDPEIDTHEGFNDAELAAVLDTQAARLDKLNLCEMAHDIRAAARRLRK